MARRSLADRLKGAAATQSELDRSQELMKKVASPARPVPNEVEGSEAEGPVQPKAEEPAKPESTPAKEPTNQTINQKTNRAANQTKKGQDRDRTVSGHQGTGKVTVKGRHFTSTVTPLFDQKRTGQGHHRDTIPSAKKKDTIGTPSATPVAEIRLAKQQEKIYDWFLKNGLKGTFNKPLLVKETGISYNTARKALYKLTKIGLIRLNYDDCTKLFDYEINPDLKVKRAKKGQYQDSIAIGTGQGQDTLGTPSLISSSSLYNKPTTETKIAAAIENDPDLGYWKERRLSPKQVERWIKEFSMSPLVILESLKHCAWEMAREEKDKPENYFYAVIKKARNYARPAGYQSHEERQNQLEKEILLRQEKAAQEARELYERRIKTEQDRAFYETMQDPECERYAECIAAMNQFDKKRFGSPLKQTGKKFENAMRRSFENVIDSE